jgi:hypothetical protein
MFRLTSPQRPLLGAEHRVSEEKRRRLEKSWAHHYRVSALPLIDETKFQRFFDEGNGRPNKSIRLLVSVLIFKDLFDLTDSEALSALEWDISWHYALDVEPEEAHTCQKTLHNFRVKVLGDDAGASLFEDTTAKIIAAAQLRTSRQRMDSTHIVSNIRLLTRLGLFVATITGFLAVLRKTHPRLSSQVPVAIRERYLDREGYFADVKNAEAPRRLDESALDTHALVVQWRDHAAVSSMPEYELLARLYRDQCVPPDVASPEKIDLQKSPPSSSLQSPSDPDVTYGHKGKGYSVQIAETCEEGNPFQVVTAVVVHGANESDQTKAIEVIEETAKTCGQAPERVHADCGYGSGENFLAARELDTELLAPIGAKASSKLPVTDFAIDMTTGNATSCPAGRVPRKYTTTKSLRVLSWFSRSDCDACPIAAQCPTEPRRDFRVLGIADTDIATALRRVEQQTPAFKEQHKIRSGIEATNSEFKRGHGLRKLRVRRRPRVTLAVRLKALALNVKRYVAHLREAARAAVAAAAPMETCAC